MVERRVNSPECTAREARFQEKGQDVEVKGLRVDKEALSLPGRLSPCKESDTCLHKTGGKEKRRVYCACIC